MTDAMRGMAATTRVRMATLSCLLRNPGLRCTRCFLLARLADREKIGLEPSSVDYSGIMGMRNFGWMPDCFWEGVWPVKGIA